MNKLEARLQKSVLATLESMGLDNHVLDDKQAPEGFWEAVGVHLKKRGIKQSPKRLANLFYIIRDRNQEPAITESKVFNIIPRNLNRRQRGKLFEENINIFHTEVIRLCGEELDPTQDLDDQYYDVLDRIKDTAVLKQLEDLEAEVHACNENFLLKKSGSEFRPFIKTIARLNDVDIETQELRDNFDEAEPQVKLDSQPPTE